MLSIMKSFYLILLSLLFTNSISAQGSVQRKPPCNPELSAEQLLNRDQQVQKDTVAEIRLMFTSWSGTIRKGNNFILRVANHQMTGSFVDFQEKIFTTRYVPMCGLDCFTSMKGSYKLVGGNQVELKVESMSRDGVCTGDVEPFKPWKNTYQMVYTDKGLAFNVI